MIVTNGIGVGGPLVTSGLGYGFLQTTAAEGFDGAAVLVYKQGPKYRSNKRPWYYYQQKFNDALFDVNEPADNESFDATVDAARLITETETKLARGDTNYALMFERVERHTQALIGYIVSRHLSDRLIALEAKIEAKRNNEIEFLIGERRKRDAEKDEESEREELLELMAIIE